MSEEPARHSKDCSPDAGGASARAQARGAMKHASLPRKVTLGSVELDAPFVQAALSGYSDLAFRRLARDYGAPFTLFEALLDKIVVTPGKKQRSLLTVEADDHPVGGQLMGREPECVAQAAVALAEAGCDLIDVNFGCPVRKVLGRGRGGFLLGEPETALAILRAVCAALAGKCPVTVKMRRSLDDTPARKRHFFTILDGAFELGVSAVTVHGRTVKQRYLGRSDWGFLAEVKRHVGDRIIIGSGDLFSAEACVRMLEQTGVDAVALARGCIGNPWLFTELRALLRGEPLPPPPSIAQQRAGLARHWREVVRIYGENQAGRVMRKFGIKYSEHHPHARQVRDAFIAVRRPGDFEIVLDTWYDPNRVWPPVRRREGHGDLIAAGAQA